MRDTKTSEVDPQASRRADHYLEPEGPSPKGFERITIGKHRFLRAPKPYLGVVKRS